MKPRSRRRTAQARTLAVELLAGEAAVDVLAERPERGGELEHAVELLAVAPLPPGVVVEVLAPPGGVGADGLEMAAGIGADPDVGPRRGDRERADAPELLRVANEAPVGAAVLEAAAPTAA
jgi:hypothetical protein